MMNGYLRFGMENNRACFDIFYRKQGDADGLRWRPALSRLLNTSKPPFSEDAYLRSLNIFDEAFLTRLSTLRFTGEILAVPEERSFSPLSRLSASLRRSWKRSFLKPRCSTSSTIRH